MLNPKEADIFEIQAEDENLNTLIEIVLSNKELNDYQREQLLGMALAASSNVLQWCETEETRRG